MKLFYNIKMWFLKRKLKKSATRLADKYREYQKARPKIILTKEDRAKQLTFLDKEMEELSSICNEVDEGGCVCVTVDRNWIINKDGVEQIKNSKMALKPLEKKTMQMVS